MSLSDSFLVISPTFHPTQVLWKVIHHFFFFFVKLAHHFLQSASHKFHMGV